jgi:transmembrane protein TMEM260 (protein O-mannosyltransferase)
VVSAPAGAGERVLPSLLAGLCAFVLYLAVLPATPGVGDSAELTLALALAGVTHPTGYPLYILLGHPFVKAFRALGLPWAAAANLWSAIGAAVAVLFLARLGETLVARGTPGRWAAAAAPVALIGLHPLWISAATQAEVYSWWFAWIAGAAYFTASRLRAPAAPDAPTATIVAGAAWGAVAGLGLAHHLLAVTFVAPLTAAWILVRARSGRRLGGFVAGMALGAAIPLASYGLVAWRAFHPAVIQWPVEPTWSGIWAHMRGAAYGRYLGHFAPNAGQVRMLDTLIAPFLPLVALTGLWALRAAPAFRPTLMALLAGVALLAAFVFRYGVPDPAMYLVPALMVGWLAAVPALGWLARWASARGAVLVLAALVVANGVWGIRHALEERRRLDRADSLIRAAWREIPFDTGVVLWRDDHCSRLQVFEWLERSRPGLLAENPNMLAWGPRRRAFIDRVGFDPLEGLELSNPAYVDSITGNVRRRARLPVIAFPEVLDRVRARPWRQDRER